MAAGYSVAEVAQRAHVNRATVWRLEQGLIAKPQAESLLAIGRVIDIEPADIFATVGWLSGDQLPTFVPYLRAKYAGLPAKAEREIVRHFDLIVQKHEFRSGAKPARRNAVHRKES